MGHKKTRVLALPLLVKLASGTSPSLASLAPSLQGGITSFFRICETNPISAASLRTDHPLGSEREREPHNHSRQFLHARKKKFYPLIVNQNEQREWLKERNMLGQCRALLTNIPSGQQQLPCRTRRVAVLPS